MYSEKRRHVRAWCGRVKVNDVRTVPGNTRAICRNISAGGLLLETHEPLEPGMELAFSMGLTGLRQFAAAKNIDSCAGDAVSGRAMVLRCFKNSGNWHSGLQFVNMQPEVVELLNSFINAKMDPACFPPKI